MTWYGILVASGFMAGLWTASRRAIRDRIHPETIFDLGPWLLVGAIVGARAMFVITYWKDEHFDTLPWTEIFMVWHGGIVFYGGFIGASLACIVFAWRKRLSVWRLADILAPSIALGSFFGRYGCLMHGCCYGRPTTLHWAIHFPPEHATKGVGVHPTQIYDSTLNLLLYAVLAWLFRRKKFDGQVFAVYMISYAVLRSFVEYFRGDYTPVHYLGPLTPAQLLSIGIAAAGVILLLTLPRTRAELKNLPRPPVPEKA